MWLPASMRFTTVKGSETEPVKLLVEVLDQGGAVIDSAGPLALPLADPITYSGVGIDCTPQTSWEGVPDSSAAPALKGAAPAGKHPSTAPQPAHTMPGRK